MLKYNLLGEFKDVNFYYKNNFYEVVGENDFSEILALYEEK